TTASGCAESRSAASSLTHRRSRRSAVVGARTATPIRLTPLSSDPSGRAVPGSRTQTPPPGPSGCSDANRSDGIVRRVSRLQAGDCLLVGGVRRLGREIVVLQAKEVLVAV